MVPSNALYLSSFKMICVSEPTTLNFGISPVQEREVVFSKDTPPISQLVT